MLVAFYLIKLKILNSLESEREKKKQCSQLNLVGRLFIQVYLFRMNIKVLKRITESVKSVEKAKRSNFSLETC